MEQIRVFLSINQVVHEVVSLVVCMSTGEIVLVAGQHFYLEVVHGGKLTQQ